MHNPLNNLGSRIVGARLHLGIASDGIAMSRYESAWDRKPVLVGEITCATHDLTQSCETLLQNSNCRGLPLAISLGHGWGKLFIVRPPSQVQKKSVLVAAAAMRYQSLFGKSNEAYQIEADWQLDRPFLACAYPKSLLATLHKIAQQNQSPLLAIVPCFVAAWNTWRDQITAESWLGVINNNFLAIGITADTHPLDLAEIRNISIPATGHNFEWLDELLRRAALQHNVAIPKKISLIGNQHRYWHQPDISKTNQFITNLDNFVSITSPNQTVHVSAALQLLACGIAI